MAILNYLVEEFVPNIIGVALVGALACLAFAAGIYSVLHSRKIKHMQVELYRIVFYQYIGWGGLGLCFVYLVQMIGVRTWCDLGMGCTPVHGSTVHPVTWLGLTLFYIFMAKVISLYTSVSSINEWIFVTLPFIGFTVAGWFVQVASADAWMFGCFMIMQLVALLAIPVPIFMTSRVRITLIYRAKGKWPLPSGMIVLLIVNWGVLIALYVIGGLSNPFFAPIGDIAPMYLYAIAPPCVMLVMILVVFFTLEMRFPVSGYFSDLYRYYDSTRASLAALQSIGLITAMVQVVYSMQQSHTWKKAKEEVHLEQENVSAKYQARGQAPPVLTRAEFRRKVGEKIAAMRQNKAHVEGIPIARVAPQHPFGHEVVNAQTLATAFKSAMNGHFDNGLHWAPETDEAGKPLLDPRRFKAGEEMVRDAIARTRKSEILLGRVDRIPSSADHIAWKQHVLKA